MKKIIPMILATLFACSLSYAGFVTDRDGNRYKTVQIGNLEWMAEDSKFETEGSQCVDEDADPDNCVREYGRGISDENLCPVGWRLPTTDDIEYVNSLFLPENYDQMTEKQKRHALPDMKKSFNKFFDSIKWPKTIFGKTNILYHAICNTCQFRQYSLRSFYRGADENTFDGGDGQLWISGGNVSRVRCVKKQ